MQMLLDRLASRLDILKQQVDAANRKKNDITGLKGKYEKQLAELNKWFNDMENLFDAQIDSCYSAIKEQLSKYEVSTATAN